MVCRLLCAVAVVVGLGGAALAQAPDSLGPVNQQQLDGVKVVLAQQAAWNKGDLDGYVSRLKDAADTVAMLGGPVRGLTNIRSSFHINYPNREAMGTLDYSDVEARALGETFTLTTGKYHLERSRKGGGPVDGTFCEVLEKTPSGWFVIFTETT